MVRTERLRVALVVLLVLALTACGGDGSGEGVSIDDPRARSTAPTAERGAVYLEVVNTTDEDRSIVSASVAEDVAGVVELHETLAAEDAGNDPADQEMDRDAGDDGAANGMGAMRMREVTSIDVAAGETVTLEPGGLHVMLLELAGPLEAGATFELTLTFDDGTDQTVTVEVRDEV